MKRSNKIIVMCHCVLNANSIVNGLASYPGINMKAVMPYLEKGAGIVQLPCPETTYLGMKRWGMTREQYDHPGYRRHCRQILVASLDEIEAFRDAGYEILGCLGVKGSPNCGVEHTCGGYSGGSLSSASDLQEQMDRVVLTKGSGVFMDVFKQMLGDRGICLEFMETEGD